MNQPLHNALASGNIRLVNKILGSPFYLKGSVVHGNHLGKSLGFPTANIEYGPDQSSIIAPGVYAVFIDYSGKVYRGMANIGTRPTVGGKELRTEVNLFDFEGNLYGKTLVVFFMERLREEKKFPGIEMLVAQIHRDKELANQLLSHFKDPNSNT